MNSFGIIYRLMSFGESHGKAIGGVIDGMPAGLHVDFARLQAELDRRRPGQSELTSHRREPDRLQVLSGLFDGKTTGTPIGFVIENCDAHSDDYAPMAELYRPSHADYTYDVKYGLRDWRGGGRTSARETAVRIVAGAFARQALDVEGISVCACTSQVGDIVLPRDKALAMTREAVDANAVRCPDPGTATRMEQLIRRVRDEGDTVGGIVTCVIRGVPAGLGEPVFDKVQARLAYAMLSINAAKGFDYGLGFDEAGRRGSEMNDPFCSDGKGGITTRTNHSGGIQGGITNGRDIWFRVAFKPVPTLLRDVPTVDRQGRETILHARGRHDPCVLPRAVPVVEAMAAAVMLDMLLLGRCSRI